MWLVLTTVYFALDIDSCQLPPKQIFLQRGVKIIFLKRSSRDAILLNNFRLSELKALSKCIHLVSQQAVRYRTSGMFLLVVTQAGVEGSRVLLPEIPNSDLHLAHACQPNLMYSHYVCYCLVKGW